MNQEAIERYLTTDGIGKTYTYTYISGKSVAKMLRNYRENESIFAKAGRGLHLVVQSCHFNFLEGKLSRSKAFEFVMILNID